jgi:putative membrane protein
MRNVFAIGTMVLAMGAAQAAAQTPPQSQPQNRNQPQTEPNRPSDQSRTGQKPAAGQQVDRQFAMDAAHINMAEVELGKLAKEKGASEPVKSFGDRLVADHGKALDELKGIVKDKNITLPTQIDAKHKATYDKLSKMSGAAFDKSFAQEMVNGHKEALQKAQTAAKSASDAEIKAFANKMVTSVQAHLKVAQGLAGGAVGTSGTQDRNPGAGRNPGGAQEPPAKPNPAKPNPPTGGQPDRDPR